MSDKTTFLKYMMKRQFSITANMMGNRNIIPHHYKTPEGDHVLITGIYFCMFNGVDTAEGDLGCITFYYTGIKRQKHFATSYIAEILKEAECYDTPRRALEGYKEWLLKTTREMACWKVIL